MALQLMKASAILYKNDILDDLMSKAQIKVSQSNRNSPEERSLDK